MASLNKVKVVLLASEWNSKHGGLSTFNRELAIHLAKHPKVEVFFFLPKCDRVEMQAAKKKQITLVEAEPIIGLSELQWLCHPPKWLQIDFVIGHGVVLGSQAQIIRKNSTCKWIQFVHTDPEELGMFKDYPDAVSKGEEKHKDEVKLCEMADVVVAVGPKLAEACRSYLRYCKKDQDVVEITPGIFSEFSKVVQSNTEGSILRVLSFGRGDAEDFHLKGFDIAAKAVAKVNDTHLIFVGATSKKQDEVAARLKKCHLTASRLRVKAYMEIRDDLNKLFSSVDLVIMPSRTEGFGLAALEALSAGLPILVTGNSGFGKAPAEVTFGSSCVVPSEDAKKWAQEIDKVKAKKRATRLDESKSLLKNYAKKYKWQDQTRDLIEKMMAIRNGRQFNLFLILNAIISSHVSLELAPLVSSKCRRLGRGRSR